MTRAVLFTGLISGLILGGAFLLDSRRIICPGPHSTARCLQNTRALAALLLHFRDENGGVGSLTEVIESNRADLHPEQLICPSSDSPPGERIDDFSWSSDRVSESLEGPAHSALVWCTSGAHEGGTCAFLRDFTARFVASRDFEELGIPNFDPHR